MKVTEYQQVVRDTDQFTEHERSRRKQISLYGLVGEIGSLTSAVKKALLAGYETTFNAEVAEELGDVFWYLFNLSTILEGSENQDILTNDIRHVRNEVNEKGERGDGIRAALENLDGDRLLQFQRRADDFLAKGEVTFREYQETAYLTARTEGHVLTDVCVAVLWQLSAELLRSFTMPSMELAINRNIVARSADVVIGEIAWHLAAIASVHNISLDDILDKNAKKARFRSSVGARRRYYDDTLEDDEQLPRRMQVAFVSVDRTHARMYYHGRPLGDDLTDNAHEEDGYRFHDVMHLANAACLHWSPVLRRLLKRKRKSIRKTDEVEDGARAAIVEELVIKAIHSEAKKLRPTNEDSLAPLFPTKSHITFGLIKTVIGYVKGLEVDDAHEWQWRNAIFYGHQVYQRLREEGQGTVTVDLEEGTLSFDPRVEIGIAGVVREMGTARLNSDNVAIPTGWLNTEEAEENRNTVRQAELVSTKGAILNALGYLEDDWEAAGAELVLSRMDTGKFSVKATGKVQERIWALGIIEFKITMNHVGDTVVCTALGLTDTKDVKP